MPGYQGHLAGGAVTFLAVYYVSSLLAATTQYTLKESLIALLFCLLGSLFPDVDTTSVGQRVFYTLLAVLIVMSILAHQWSLLATLSLLSLFPVLVNHRGVIHSVWFVTLAPLVIPAVMWYNNMSPAAYAAKLQVPTTLFGNSLWLIYAYFVAGALSHLVLDYGFFRLIRMTVRPIRKFFRM